MDTSSGTESFTAMMHVSGVRPGTIETPFLISRNAARSYPIRGVPDDVPGVCYRSGRKGWMDGQVFEEMLNEPRFIRPLPWGGKRIIFVDNVGSHQISPGVQSALKKINCELRFLPPNSTDLTQPCDAFVISTFKTFWRGMWDGKKAEDIMNKQFMDKAGGSGKVANPGKHYFLKFAAEATRRARAKVDKNGMNYARKSMILCGLSADTDSVWRETQLRPELQHLIKKHQLAFDRIVSGLPPASAWNFDTTGGNAGGPQARALSLRTVCRRHSFKLKIPRTQNDCQYSVLNSSLEARISRF